MSDPSQPDEARRLEDHAWGTIEHTDAGSVYRDKRGNLLAWDRVLTERETRMVLKNPYQMFMHHTPSLGVRWWHRLLRGLRKAITP